MIAFIIIDLRDDTVVGNQYPNRTIATNRAKRFDAECGEMVHVVQSITTLSGCKDFNEKMNQSK